MIATTSTTKKVCNFTVTLIPADVASYLSEAEITLAVFGRLPQPQTVGQLLAAEKRWGKKLTAPFRPSADNRVAMGLSCGGLR